MAGAVRFQIRAAMPFLIPWGNNKIQFHWTLWSRPTVTPRLSASASFPHPLPGEIPPHTYGVLTLLDRMIWSGWERWD